MQLPYDPAVAFLGIYPKRNKNTFTQKSYVRMLKKKVKVSHSVMSDSLQPYGL